MSEPPVEFPSLNRNVPALTWTAPELSNGVEMDATHGCAELFPDGGERLLVKVPGERYPALRGREGERIRITWKEEDVQLLSE